MKIGDVVEVAGPSWRVGAVVTELAPMSVRLQYREPGRSGAFNHWFHVTGPRPGFRMGDHGEPPNRFEVPA